MPMTLKGDDGTEFELALVEHRFEEMQDGERDEVWPEISFRVGTDTDSWEESAPCVNLHELSALAEWLEAVGAATPELDEVDILESNLSFSLAEEHNGDVTMRIGFELDDMPEWVLDPPTDESYVLMRLDREQCRLAAAELRADLGRG